MLSIATNGQSNLEVTLWELTHMPKLQPHVAFDSEQWIIHTVRCTDILSMREGSDKFGSMVVVVIVEYTGKNAVPRARFKDRVFC